MEKLKDTFRRADSNDILTYAIVGAMTLMLVAIFSLPVIEHYVNQNSEMSTQSQSLRLGH